MLFTGIHFLFVYLLCFAYLHNVHCVFADKLPVQGWRQWRGDVFHQYPFSSKSSYCLLLLLDCTFEMTSTFFLCNFLSVLQFDCEGTCCWMILHYHSNTITKIKCSSTPTCTSSDFM